MTVRDLANVLTAAANRADDDLRERKSYSHDEDAAAKLLRWLAEGASYVADETDDDARRRMTGER